MKRIVLFCLGMFCFLGTGVEQISALQEELSDPPVFVQQLDDRHWKRGGARDKITANTVAVYSEYEDSETTSDLCKILIEKKKLGMNLEYLELRSLDAGDEVAALAEQVIRDHGHSLRFLELEFASVTGRTSLSLLETISRYPNLQHIQVEFGEENRDLIMEFCLTFSHYCISNDFTTLLDRRINELVDSMKDRQNDLFYGTNEEVIFNGIIAVLDINCQMMVVNARRQADEFRMQVEQILNALQSRISRSQQVPAQKRPRIDNTSQMGDTVKSENDQ